jgi:hypothetical protein
VWEKLADDGSIHDRDDVYAWSDAFTAKIAALNTVPCFAGHCDWRLPNLRELTSLQNLGNYPSVSPDFDTACAPGCTVLTCSCTNTMQYYWSSSTYVAATVHAWGAEFAVGLRSHAVGKPTAFCVREVRGVLFHHDVRRGWFAARHRTSTISGRRPDAAAVRR